MSLKLLLCNASKILSWCNQRGTIEARIQQLESATPQTANVTEVLRSRINIAADPNINPNAAVQVTGLSGVDANLDQIGVSVTGNQFTIPNESDTDYVLHYEYQLDSNAQRTNFTVLLQDGSGATLQEDHGNAYGRNSNNADETALRGSFSVESGGTYQIATQREANAGDVDLDADSAIEIVCYRQKTITYLEPN